MEKNEYVVAIDLGTSKVVTLVGRKSDLGKIEIVASSIGDSLGGVARGEIKNSEHISKAVKETIEKIETELSIAIKEAYVGVSGQHIKCNKHSGSIFIENNDGEVKRRDIQRLSESMSNLPLPMGESIMHIIPQEYAIDGEIELNEPVGALGKKLEAMFNIITGDKNALMRVDKCLSKIEIKTSQLIFNPLASAEAVLIPDEKELGVAVVDIGGGTTDICIYHNGIIRHVAVIPLGGSIVNKDIRSYGILERHVESLKVKYGGAIGELERADKYITIPGLNARDPKEISFRNLASIIEARMLDIVDCVMMEIRHSGYANRLGAGIVLTGGCASMKNLDLLFKNHTGYEVRVAIPNNYITEDSVELVNSPTYSTAVGLLIKAIGEGVVTKVEQLRRPGVVTNSSITSKPFTPPVQAPAPTFTPPQRAQQPIPPVAKPIIPPVAEDFEDEEEEENTKTKNRGGFFKNFGDKISSMFEVIDDDKL